MNHHVNNVKYVRWMLEVDLTLKQAFDVSKPLRLILTIHFVDYSRPIHGKSSTLEHYLGVQKGMR